MASPVSWSVVIPTRDTRDLTLACLATIPASPDVATVVVDDGSRDGTADAVEQRFPQVRLLALETPVGFSRAVNLGAAEGEWRRLLILNSDTELEPETWDVLDRIFGASTHLGIVGGALFYADGTAQWSGGRTPTLPWLVGLASGLPALVGRVPGTRAIRPVAGSVGGSVDWVPAAAMALRREVWEEVGPLDEGYRLYCQDLDLCSRARQAGWAIAVAPGFRVLHHHGATVGAAPGAVNRQNPELLWMDLLRWARKTRGERWARRAAFALRAGARMRLLGRWILSRMAGGSARRSWRRDSVVYRRALMALRRSA